MLPTTSNYLERPHTRHPTSLKKRNPLKQNTRYNTTRPTHFFQAGHSSRQRGESKRRATHAPMERSRVHVSRASATLLRSRNSAGKWIPRGVICYHPCVMLSPLCYYSISPVCVILSPVYYFTTGVFYHHPCAISSPPSVILSPVCCPEKSTWYSTNASRAARHSLRGDGLHVPARAKCLPSRPSKHQQPRTPRRLGTASFSSSLSTCRSVSSRGIVQAAPEMLLDSVAHPPDHRQRERIQALRLVEG